MKEIIEMLKQACKETNLTVSQDMILDCAVRIYNTKSIDHKNTAQNNISQKQIQEATEKQKNMLNTLGIKFDKNISKQEAYQLIAEKLGK